MADALMKYETIDTDQINDIMSGKQPRAPKDWVEPDTGSGGGPKPSGESPAEG